MFKKRRTGNFNIAMDNEIDNDREYMNITADPGTDYLALQENPQDPDERRQAEEGGHDNIAYEEPEVGFLPDPNGSPNRVSHNEYEEMNENNQDFKGSVQDQETGEHPLVQAGAHTADDIVVIEKDQIEEEELARERECMYFEHDGDRLRIDYVLVYKEEPKRPERAEMRRVFHKHLEEYDIIVHDSPHTDITDTTLHYVLLHAPWDTLLTGAELMTMKKRLKMPKTLAQKVEKKGGSDCSPGCQTSQEYIPDEGEFFTAPIHHNRLDLFEILDTDTFFTNAERSLIVKEVLDRTSFTPDNAEEVRFGVMRMLQEGAYISAYPLHEGPYKTSGGVVCQAAYEGADKDRALLYETWVRPSRCCCFQPLDLIRKYFGEKIGLYFAWLGFYTQMLVPATIIGVIAFIYGVATIFRDPIGNEICEDRNISNTVMCPQCNVRCDYWELKESCIYSRITYVFDNYATIVFTFFMGVWATCFLEFWKRKQNELQYEWDVQDYEAQERMRPEFEFKVRRRRENPITKVPEPYLTRLSWCCRTFTSLSVALFFVLLVMGAILGVIVYRFVVVSLLYSTQIHFVSTWAKIITSLTASVINLIVIMILGVVYKRVAYHLTELEMHRTETDFEDAYIFKMFIFQFANYYGTTFYIAFFKGKFQAEPGSTRFYLFNKFEPDPCDPSGCMIDLLIQLFIVMVGKQALNQFKEIIIPKICVSLKQRQAKKEEKEGGVYVRWMQDQDMQPVDRLMLFEEYLEMVIQYGFVTIFVAAFPLAPLFALINNVTEIRLDAYKMVTQFRRPNPSKAQDIGVWFDILQTMTYIAILSNSVIIAWTSDFVPRMVYLLVHSPDSTLNGYVDNSLSIFNTGNYTNGTAPDNPSDIYKDLNTCRYKGYYLEHDDPNDPYGFSPIFWQVVVARLAFILVFEHACLLVAYLIAYLVPDMSSEVKRLISYEKALNRHLTFKATFEDKKDHKKQENTLSY